MKFVISSTWSLTVSCASSVYYGQIEIELIYKIIVIDVKHLFISSSSLSVTVSNVVYVRFNTSPTAGHTPLVISHIFMELRSVYVIVRFNLKFLSILQIYFITDLHAVVYSDDPKLNFAK